MKLVLFTNGFPYKKQEPFVLNEFTVAQKHCSQITLFTLYGLPSEKTIADLPNTTCLAPVLEGKTSKKKLLFKGVFNLSPLAAHFNEFFKKKIVLKPKQVYWFFTSLFLTRTVLSSVAYKQLVLYLQDNKNVVLYFYWGDNLCWLIPYIEKKFPGNDFKIVIRYHGSDLYEHFKADYAPLRKEILKRANAIFTVSEFGQHYLAQKYPEVADKLKIARLAVADNGLNPFQPTSEKVILSISNVIPLKRLHLIFNALQDLTSKITWHHFGDGSELPALKNLAKQAKKHLTIIFHGHVTNTEVLNFCKTNSIDVFINVSSSEGVPVSIMEAFSFGIPVIATQVGGTAELVNTQNGILLKKDFNTEQLMGAITEIITADETSSSGLRANARNTFEAMSAIKNYENFYQIIKRL